MKKNYLCTQRQLLFFVFALFGLCMVTGRMNAQQAINIIWDSETGCLVYDDKKREYTEEIEDGPCVRVCENSVVTYTLTGDATNWVTTNWSIAGGTVIASTLTTVTVQWGSAGWATVAATVTKNDDTQQTEEICVEVIHSPRAHFGVMPNMNADPIRACAEETLFFVNDSDTDGGTALIAYYWDFGDGTTSPQFEPQHAYASAGSYTVSLTVTNACNCSNTYYVKVEVGHVGFDIVCPGVVCDSERASYSVPDFVAQGCANAGYNWSVSGGHIVSQQPYGPSIMVDWDNVDSTGFGYVTFDASGCDIECAGVTTIQVPVIQSIGTIIGEVAMCTNEQNIYKLPQWPSTVFNWTLLSNGPGANLINTLNPNEVVVESFANPGTIVLQATYTNTLLNCGGIATLTINVAPRAEVSGPTTLCADNTGTYTLANGYAGDWQLTGPIGTVNGSGPTFTHQFTVAGNYTLVVSGTTFCRPTQTAIVVRDKEVAPVAITGPAVACPGISETYSVSNTITGTQIVWSVTNGTFDGSNTGDSVSIAFGPTGPYTITAWRENVTEPNCPSDAITKTVTLPVVDLVIDGPTQVCASTYANYSVSYADGEVYNWYIDSPLKGSVSSGQGTQNIEVLWNQTSGFADVVLEVTKCGVVQPEKRFTVEIISTPNVQLVNPDTQICRGEPLTLTLASTPTLTSGTITWDFGDGTVLNSTAPGGLTMSHTYTAVNTGSLNYNIIITVTSPNGCVNSAVVNHSVIVLPAPVASITPGGTYSVCPESALNNPITVNIQGGLTNISSITWYNGVNPISLPAFTTTYNVTSYGNYYVVVQNLDGCTTTTNHVYFNDDCIPTPPCTITPTPVVQITSAQNNCGTITVNASASGNPTGFQWITSSPTVSQSTTNTTGIFTFAESGSYTIYYKAIYNGNCAVTVSQTVIVEYMPDLRYTITCNGNSTYNVTLLDNSNYFPSTPINLWQFYVDGSPVGNGLTTSYLANLAPGIHTIGLTIDGAIGSPCSVTPITIDLPAMPSAVFSHDAPKCEDAVVDFTAPVTAQTGLSYFWDFGDFSYNAQKDPEKVYTNPGFYEVILKVTNQYGCTAIYSEYIEITENRLAGTIEQSAVTACQGTPVTLTYSPALNSDIPDTYTWMNGTTVVGTTTNPINNINVYTSGNYWVKVETLLGCLVTNIAPVKVTFINAPIANISGPDAVCISNAFTLSVPNAGVGAIYEWSQQGGPIISTLQSVTQAISSLGTYTFNVTVKIPDGLGGYCTSTDSHTVTVNPMPATPSISLAIVDCTTYTFNLHASAPGQGTFTWSNGASGPDIQVTQGGVYQVRFTNPSGCYTTASIEIPKDPAIYLWAVPDGCYEFCKAALQNVTITGPGGANIFPQWQWLVNGNGVTGGNNSPVTPIDVANYGPGTYQLVLDNGYCPRISDEVHIDNLGDCKCDIRIRLKEIKPQFKEFCFYEFYFEIDNPYGPMQITLSLPNGEGVFVPTTVMAPSGTSLHMVTMIPFGSFAGGTIIVNFQGLIDEGKTCLVSERFEFPACEGSGGHRLTQQEDDAAASKLVVTPNPATSIVSLNYTYAGSVDGDTRSLEIFSPWGVLLESNNPKEANGSWQPDLSRFPAGQYIVVMRLNGSLVLQKSLILQ
ncbi:PKD domain-containing protein [Flavobacterium subsaxonicum]|uniref:PKD/Chitinase domain-containing protein n=1 Tax=Flavobacterium subsaxonicum WB 4.1-42 = DSM 21790 TaxID=1121898 RepID=A0A0A2MN23_9FLAO|nr:PKD domain-containing protein [Flavobacterium subsaxonicum]KGO93694.1 hypothetical protein Q766_06970 [Flavobacterium subsaxonicum WB 4.1-42 = DSM 21790]